MSTSYLNNLIFSELNTFDVFQQTYVITVFYACYYISTNIKIIFVLMTTLNCRERKLYSRKNY